MAKTPPIDRLLARIEVHPLGCWGWRGALNGPGYGVITIKLGQQALVHRVAYTELVGPIPPGHQIDHLCFNRRCCNPAHLEPVLHTENIRRMRAAGRGRGGGGGGRNAEKTHCIHGHEFTPSNTYVGPDGRRKCRACQQRHSQRVNAAVRAARAADSDPRSTSVAPS